MKNKRKIPLLIWIFLFLAACTPKPTEVPGLVQTMISGTQTAAVLQTENAKALFTSTPTFATLRPTITPYPTGTTFVFVPTPSDTPTPLPSATHTPYIRTTWPDWKTGEVVTMPRGTGLNIGTNKKFSGLVGIMVKVERENGVKLRPIPSKAVGGIMEDKGAAFTLTGIMNKNPNLGWLFVQVIAADGEKYWVGGWDDEDENTSIAASLSFYYPKYTPSPIPDTTSTPFTPTP